MENQKVLNWVGIIWFVINLPVVPFTGSLTYAMTAEYFSNSQVVFSIITFSIFLAIALLSKLWSNKFIKLPVILSLIPFLYALLQLVIVHDFLVRNSAILMGIMIFVIITVICIAVVRAMRGELNQRL